MNISEIQFEAVRPKDGLVGFVSFVIDHEFYVGSIGVITRLDGSGYRLTFPTKKVGEKSLNIFNPITKAAGETLELHVNEVVSKLLHQ